MKTLEKLLSVFLIIMGILIISVWTMLLITGQVPDIKEDLISLLFHWTSELLLALMSIIVGIAILFKKGMGTELCFFCTGARSFVNLQCSFLLFFYGIQFNFYNYNSVMN